MIWIPFLVFAAAIVIALVGLLTEKQSDEEASVPTVRHTSAP